MSQIDVGEVLKANQRPVAGGCVDVESGFQRRSHQRIEISDTTGFDNGNIGQLGERSGRDSVARDDDESQPSSL